MTEPVGILNPAPVGRDGRTRIAVSFLDVVGYSILMATDERQTHSRWMKILNTVVKPEAVHYAGQIVKSTGDGVLAQFPSAFHALQWADAVQQGISTATDEQHTEHPIAVRISIHVGEVFSEEDDIYGHAVNLAARLQEHAPPGGIVLSDAARDALGTQLEARGRELGPIKLKNFTQPVRAYILDPARPGLSIPVLAVESNLPSIAVLPFRDNNNDTASGYFGDGIVEDIITSLASLRELLVISRGSTLFYRGREPDPREVGRALGVRYVLSGSVRRTGRTMQVTVELSDAVSGAILSGERSETSEDDIFAVQDQIVSDIVGRIAPHIRSTELERALRKRPDVFNAYDCTLKGLSLLNTLDRDAFMDARRYFERAISEDNAFSMPVAWLARWHSIAVGQGWVQDQRLSAADALDSATRAIALDKRNSVALATYGHVKSFLFHDCETGTTYLERALSACPNMSLAWIFSSATASYLGHGQEAIKRAEHGIRLSPFDHQLWFYYIILGMAHYISGNYGEALKWGRLAASENPGYTSTLRLLICALVGLGRMSEAREIGSRLMEREPDFRVETFACTRQPFRDPDIAERYVSHLRNAGLPA
jgi:adenylate cyclase